MHFNILLGKLSNVDGGEDFCFLCLFNLLRHFLRALWMCVGVVHVCAYPHTLMWSDSVPLGGPNLLALN